MISKYLNDIEQGRKYFAVCKSACMLKSIPKYIELKFIAIKIKMYFVSNFVLSVSSLNRGQNVGIDGRSITRDDQLSNPDSKRQHGQHRHCVGWEKHDQGSML